MDETDELICKSSYHLEDGSSPEKKKFVFRPKLLATYNKVTAVTGTTSRESLILMNVNGVDFTQTKMHPRGLKS